MSTAPVHATVVAWGGRGVMLTGSSGSGKSDLALRLIDRGWSLVGDDYVSMIIEQDQLIARPIASIAGRLEVRGIGIVEVPYLPAAPIALGVELAPPDRLPEEDVRKVHGAIVRFVRLAPFEASAPIKLELALKRLGLALEAASR